MEAFVSPAKPPATPRRAAGAGGPCRQNGGQQRRPRWPGGPVAGPWQALVDRPHARTVSRPTQGTAKFDPAGGHSARPGLASQGGRAERTGMEPSSPDL